MALAHAEASPVDLGYKIPEKYVPVFPTQLHKRLSRAFLKYTDRLESVSGVPDVQILKLSFGGRNGEVTIERRAVQIDKGQVYEFIVDIPCRSIRNSKVKSSINRIWFVSETAMLEQFVTKVVHDEGKRDEVSHAKVVIAKPEEVEKTLLTILKNTRPTQ